MSQALYTAEALLVINLPVNKRGLLQLSAPLIAGHGTPLEVAETNYSTKSLPLLNTLLC